MVGIGIIIVAWAFFFVADDPELQLAAGVIGGILVIVGLIKRGRGSAQTSAPDSSAAEERAYAGTPSRTQNYQSASSYSQSSYGGPAYRGSRTPPNPEDYRSEDGYIGYKESLMHSSGSSSLANSVEAIVRVAKDAIAADGALAFRYEKSSGEVTDRRVEPKDIYKGYQDRLYLKAYDFLRDEERTFRLDRMSDVRVDE